MTNNKYTAQQNTIRKQVFAAIREKSYLTDTDIKRNYGRSKVVLAAIDEARKRKANGQAFSEHELFFRNFLNNADAFAKCLPSSGYSMGEHKYITNRLYGILGNSFKYDKEVIGTCDSTQEYARSSKFQARHGEVRAELTVNILAKARVLDGMITVMGKQVQKRIWKCQWIVWDYDRNKRGFITTETIAWHLENGYVVESHRGRRYKEGWFHCKDLKQAREYLTANIRDERAMVVAQKQAQKREEEERKADERKRKAQEKADKQERAAVMAHRKNYTQQEVSRAAWIIFGKIASRQDSCLFRSVWRGYKLNINEDDAFEVAVKDAFETICKEHDVVKELSKHNSRERQAYYYSKQPVNILQHEMVANFHQAHTVDEQQMHLPHEVLYAYNDRDKRIMKILAKMYRRQLAAKHEAVAKSSELADALQHMYVYRDSIAAGNCVPGTDGFLADHNLQKTDTRSGEFLLRISRNTWQHANVARIVKRYIGITYPDFYQQNEIAINSVLSTL